MEHRRFLLLFLFFFFQIFLCCFMSGVQGLSASTDKAALASFKNALSDPQSALSSWTQNTSHCSWYGVSCSIKGARVRSLNLSSLGLFGPIPSQLSNLSSLYMLDLSNNSFYGQIPSDIGRLSRLQYLILYMNKISSTIPVLLSQCHNLKWIILVQNNLTGNIPSELGSLQRLETLNFALNRLTGVIPETLGNLTFLEKLILARNQLTGQIPSELGRLRNLRDIQLSENQLSGEIPLSIYNISSLFFLSVTDNKLTGKLPSDVDLSSALPKLMELFLAQNRFEGMLPSSLFNASRIQSLDLSNNGFQGPIPLFEKMNDLVLLNLGSNFLSSTTMLNLQLIDSLRNCTQLKVLKIYSNSLTGQFPSSVANLSTHLQHVCFADNSLTGRFPKGIENFQELISLSIEQNSFVGEIPEALASLKTLQNFAAFDNMLSGEIPDIFGNFTQLSDLLLGGNQFFGRIPTSIGSCKRLNILNLAANRLSGSIPKEIYGLSSLVELYLQQNALSGPLLAEFGNLKQIQLMNVSGNKLSGNISSTIGSCSSLIILSMAGNNFTGFIPSTIGELASLETLDLSSNSLTGAIPEELAELQYLVKLNFSFNQLEGQIPTSGVFLNLGHDSLKGNNMLCNSNHTITENLGLPRCNAERKNKHILLKVILPVAIVTCLVIFFCFLFTFISRKKQKNKKGKGISLPKGFPPMMSYSDIRLATDNFSAKNLIGKGGFGSVYKGIFRNLGDESDIRENVLAIKVLDLQKSKAARSFEAECETLRNIRHRNLVKVITSCSSIEHTGEEFKALVMEFMSHGNLDKWLYGGDGLCLTLLQRLNIAIDVASAMDYLHHDCEPPIVHCDLKPGNVLLDHDMVAHVADFGLARFVSQHSSGNGSWTIGLKGSIGYIAPEYGLGGSASTSGDVYSFGILLLELFIAKKPTNEMFQEGLNLNNFATKVNENHVTEIADPRLFRNDEHFSSESTSTSSYLTDGDSSRNSNGSSSRRISVGKGEEFIAAVIRVGLSCAADSVNDRLTMRESLSKLQKIKKAIVDIV
ncbi:putative receptor-like protein kinase At3g47110 [Ricinus communis]|uniref:putative receptor-like protein kinase At3g47110 n=1 Tax=Ricinus communis TaxID=3988 RepID=UPI00201A9882|nr:putative receptor-like protein kinase At3g47110 [Ricinus communis]